MKYLHYDFGFSEKAYIVPISDIHIGHPACDFEKLDLYLKWIKDNNAYIILNGDLLDCNIKDSVGNVYKAVMPPQEQRKKLVEIFKPYKDRIIAITQGNHEERISREVGEDILEVFAEILGIEDKYDPEGIILHVSIGRDKRGKRIGYTFYTTHGWANGRKQGSADNQFDNVRLIVLADCYILGHTHKQGAFVVKYSIPEPRVHKIFKMTQTCVSSGTFKKWDDFAEKKGMPDVPTGSPIIILNGKQKSLQVLLNVL